MDNKDQDGNEELIIENCKRCNPYCTVGKKKKKDNTDFYMRLILFEL